MSYQNLKINSVSGTARYWFQYMDCVQVVKMFIYAERTGDWNLHSNAIYKMLNLFAATGHLHYAKCISRMYLQQMLDLPFKYPNLHRQYVEHGYFTIRWSDCLWAGLWSDLVIEQVMLRPMKGRGCLTRVRGFSERARLQWVHTTHECAVIHETMTSITSLHLTSSEQHTEMGKAKRKTDQTDEQKLSSWVQNPNPFTRFRIIK